MSVISVRSRSAAGTTSDGRWLVASFLGCTVFYCVVTLWYVATFPDAGLRCLLPESGRSGPGIEIQEYLDVSWTVTDPAPKPGDRLLRLNGRAVSTFLDFVQSLQSLRFAQIPPGGQLAPGSDPVELKVPPLVEVYSRDPGTPPVRLVAVEYQRKDAIADSAGKTLTQTAFLPVRPVTTTEIGLTIIWFGCQLTILMFAATSWWYRPYDRVARAFCLMSTAAMGAFVPGFHWWILPGNPLLNIPFIICAAMLPALVLDFFLAFPREFEGLRNWRRARTLAVYGPATLVSILTVLTYWSCWVLNGPLSSGPPTAFQKLAAVAQIIFRGSISANLPGNTALQLLQSLRILAQIGMGIGSLYFTATVARLAASLFISDTPRERRQVVAILGAALLATLPMGYTLFLAFFRPVDFALGRAQIPMFVASMLFMAAYSYGMLRDRLMLAEDVDDRNRRYVGMSLLVSASFAVLMAAGGMQAQAWNLPLSTSTTQQIALFLILLLAAGLSLWVRDQLQSIVDRRFFSEKYQLDRAMQQLNRSAAYLADPSAMAEMTLKTCEDVTGAAWSAIYVRDGQGVLRQIGSRGSTQVPEKLATELLQSDPSLSAIIPRLPSANRESMEPIQRLLHDLRAELLCRLEVAEGLHGVILLGRRRDGLVYSAEDFAFLQAMAQMSVLALHSSRANQTMARLNAELKTKMESISEQQRQLAALRSELTILQQEAGQNPVQQSDVELDREGVRGSSPALLSVLTQVRKVARSDSTVLIRGESGTGKELLARVIHRNSERAAASLICVNCAALSSSLLESELFGHVRGAFTGAHADKPGRFLAAHGGTLFLDEIGDISAETQVKLLRVLQERRFEPVGSDRSIDVDVRLVAATNRNLEELIAKGEFREDLFYRLNVVSLTLPALRDRQDDLAELVFYFLSRAARKSRKQIRQIEPAALEALQAHPWPGNIRELENVIERAVVLTDSDVITIADLPDELRNSKTTVQPVRASVRTTSATALTGVARKAPPQAVSQQDEERTIREALRVAGGNKAVAARSLNLPRSTFFSRCRRYGIT
ncbi:MAG: sigma 54-interacting transcriptional regulator [Planctomycetaceae bacterium]